MGWHAAAKGYDGFLRWAYDSWTADPLHDTRHVNWPAGDCWLVYPGVRSSIRFERLREGIIDHEEIRILRQLLERRQDATAKQSLACLDAMLKRFTYTAGQQPAAELVCSAQELLSELTREAAHGCFQRGAGDRTGGRIGTVLYCCLDGTMSRGSVHIGRSIQKWT